MIEVFILSIIQGITEFLPISSSSHLIFISEHLNFDNKNLSIDVSLHIGSFIAVVIYFHKDLVKFYHNKILLIKILFASLPVMIVGFFLVKSGFIENIRNLELIAWTTIIFGILLFVSDKFKLDRTIDNDFTFKAAMTIGLMQILSLIPGVSRSGIAITGARLLNFKRVDAAKVSFLISIPILGAVSFFGLINLMYSDDTNFNRLNLISIIFSFFFSLITIKYFLKYIKKFSLNIFVIYRILLGFGLLYITYS